VVEEDQPTAWAQHPSHLLHGQPFVGNAAQGQGGDDGVEARVWEVQLLGVADGQVDWPGELLS